MLSIKWIGILLINALLILPAASSRNISQNMREYHFFSVVFSIFSGVLGLLVSYYTNVATGTSDLTLENLVSMEPELIIYVTSDRNKAMDKDATDKMEKNAVLENVPAVKNKKIMTISYDELMDYGPSVIDSLEKVNDFVNK